MGHGSSLERPRAVTGDGEGLVSHAGLWWLAETADLSGLTAGLTKAMAGIPGRRHRPGQTLAQMVLALADGATCLSDLAVLRNQPAMFGPVASEATVWRTFDRVGPTELAGIDAARRDARARAWAGGAGPSGGDVIIDVDSTIVTTNADKQDAAATYKRTYGHHPMLEMIAETGEMLCGILRPGNAGANTAIDLVNILIAAIEQLPGEWAAGHGPGDHTDLVQHDLLIRADSAGASHWFTEEIRARNAQFSIGHPIDHRVRDALGLGHDIAALELRHRQRARAENVIRDTKACGLANLPFDCIVNNDTWMRLCLAANDLLAWARRITCTGPLAKATPKTIRHRLLSIAGRLTPTGRRLHLDNRWPWTTHLIEAINRLRRAFRSPTVASHEPRPQAL